MSAVGHVRIFADGSVSGNGSDDSVGGFGYLLELDGRPALMGGGWTGHPSSNNTAEMTAVLVPLAHVWKRGLYDPSRTAVGFVSDSKYVVNGCNDWVHGWMRNDFKDGAVKNRQLWERLYFYLRAMSVRGKWVKGHAGHFENELVDDLAGLCKRRRIVAAVPTDPGFLQRYRDISGARYRMERTKALLAALAPGLTITDEKE